MPDQDKLPAALLHDAVMDAYELIQGFCMLQRRVADQMAPSDMADTGYWLREMENLLDDARKELKARKEYLNKQLCIIGAKQSMDGGEPNIKGKVCTAVPDIKQAPKIPKAGTPEHRQLLGLFGVPPHIADTGMLSIHFLKMQDHLTELAAEGKNPPEGLLGTFPINAVTYRKKRK